MDLSAKRIAVTGGAGFLGSYVLERLAARGCRDVFVPHIEDYNLVRPTDESYVVLLPPADDPAEADGSAGQPDS